MKRLLLLAFFVLLAPLADAAIVVRYFSTSAAGAGDGTTWADRAALFDGSNTWSAIIDDFDFSGSDSLLCYVGPGTYTCAETLQSSVTAPTAANPLIFHACDSSGNQLAVPDQDWVSAQPVWSTSNMPVITTGTNINTVNLANAHFRLLRFTTTARSGSVIATAASLDWCVVENSVSNASSSGVTTAAVLTNSVVVMSGATFLAGINTGAATLYNVRVDGSSGSGSGFNFTATASAQRCTAIRCDAGGFTSSSASTSYAGNYLQCLAANNDADGFSGTSTASQTSFFTIQNCVASGNGAYGIDAGNSRVVVVRSRLRDNATANFNGLANYPESIDNTVTDSDDATEFVDATNGDYRIKSTSSLWGRGIGAGDEPAAAGGTSGGSFTFAQ